MPVFCVEALSVAFGQQFQLVAKQLPQIITEFVRYVLPESRVLLNAAQETRPGARREVATGDGYDGQDDLGHAARVGAAIRSMGGRIHGASLPLNRVANRSYFSWAELSSRHWDCPGFG